MTYQLPDMQQVSDALNTLTNALIGLRVQVANYREFLAGLGYRTPAEWQQQLQVPVPSLDGWRGLGQSPKPIDEPVTEDEFRTRAAWGAHTPGGVDALSQERTP